MAVLEEMEPVIWKRRHSSNFEAAPWYLSVVATQAEEESELEMQAKLGEAAVLRLPVKFRQENHGRYIAITFSAKILAVSDTLEELNQKLADMELSENYYLHRIGFPTITEID